jgi:hypothetical protein
MKKLSREEMKKLMGGRVVETGCLFRCCSLTDPSHSVCYQTTSFMIDACDSPSLQINNCVSNPPWPPSCSCTTGSY